MAADRSTIEGAALSASTIGLLSSVNVVFILIGIVGNILVCVVIYRNSHLRFGMNCFIASLSIADLLVCMVSQPTYVLSLNGYSNPQFQVFYFVLTSTSLYASLNNLLCLTSNRMVAVLYPFHYEAMITQEKIQITIGVVWAVSLIEGLLRTFTVFRVATPYIRLASILVFIIMYLKIYLIARKQRNKVISQAESLTYNYRLAAINKVNTTAKTTAILAGSFVVSFLPITIVLMVNTPSKLAVEWSFSLMSCASAMNPLIYAWRSESFRDAVLKFLGCKKSTVTYCGPPCRTRAGPSAIGSFFAITPNKVSIPPVLRGTDLSTQL
ncbi:histamine H2 receptor-like [Nematostella vectensis]|uniref:histamine H2 receptor-like n=1 Tax=Nematostella vectensis TaxID=45351 RepID=UPI00207738F9|nr:histamine H2 receptor-like [Nematostella vectensis]